MPGIYTYDEEIFGYQIAELTYYMYPEGQFLSIFLRPFTFPYFYKNEFEMPDEMIFDYIDVSIEFVEKWHFITYQYDRSMRQVKIELISLELNQRHNKVIENID